MYMVVFNICFDSKAKNTISLLCIEKKGIILKQNYSQRTAGLKYRSQVTGQVTGPGHRSQVTMKNTCKFAASSYLVGICLFRPFLT